MQKVIWCVALAFAAPVFAQQPIPLRALTPGVVTGYGVLGSVSGPVCSLPDGGAIVNDPVRRRVLAFDATLAKFTIILDSASGAVNKYGGQWGALIPYLGDSTLFVDRDAQAFVVIDPVGNVVRTMAPPKLDDLGFMLGTYYGVPGVDLKGRLIYRTDRSKASVRPEKSDKPRTVSWPDSAPILRGDFDARRVDTIAMIRVGVQKWVEIETRERITSSPAVNPLPDSDGWAVLADGTVAMVRSHDYHVDWLHPDGTMTSSPKMPFDWKAIPLEEKERIIDSARADDAARRAKEPPRQGGAQIGAIAIPFATVDAADLPDFYPPIRAGFVRADRDGNVWILPTTSALAGASLVWDVVNSNGDLFERVQISAGRNIAGFGPGGIVYMSYSPAAGQIQLERAKVVR